MEIRTLLLPESNRVGIVTCRDTPWAQLSTITADTCATFPCSSRHGPLRQPSTSVSGHKEA